MHTARATELYRGAGIDVVNGPATAATEVFDWTTVSGSFLNLMVIGLITIIVAVALVPVQAAQHRFGRPS